MADIRSKFIVVYENLKKDILDDIKTNTTLPQDSIDRIARLLDHNVTGGKLIRGITVTESYSLLLGRDLTEDEFFKASVLGWGIEWVFICTVFNY